MIQLYTWKTPNGKKPAILLEELGVPYKIMPIDLSKHEQFAPEFLKISPNNKIPGLVDNDVTIFESGAILTYLAEKFEKYLPAHGPERYKVLEWTYWQVGGIGPMLGQLGYFAVRADEKVPQAIARFKEEGERLLGVLDKQL
jgi:GST-like protein